MIQKLPQVNQGTALWKTNRIKKSTIPLDYMVHLANIGNINDDPETFLQAIKCENSLQWLDIIKGKLSLIDKKHI